MVVRALKMNNPLLIVPLVLAVCAVGYMLFAICTRGFKGAMFGHAIDATHTEKVEYRVRGVKHTFRLHKLDRDDLYGLEIGRWTLIFGETSAIVISRDELLKLRDMISHFVGD